MAAHRKNAAKPPLKAQTGWSFQTDHPGRALLTFDGASTPPILGGDYVAPAMQFIHVLIDRRYSAVLLTLALIAGCAPRTNKAVAPVGTLAELRRVQPDVQEVKVD